MALAVSVVKLEQNYRSTGTILAAANAVVSHNRNRKAKKLFTEAGEGDKISVYMAPDERDEGRWIAGEIERLHGQGISYDETAVFYRTNAQSRSLEDMLLRAGVPYRIVGGTKFFDRAELRDVIRPDIAGTMGAYGAALLARDRAGATGTSSLLSREEIDNLKVKRRNSHCGLCSNNCQLTMPLIVPLLVSSVKKADASALAAEQRRCHQAGCSRSAIFL